MTLSERRVAADIVVIRCSNLHNLSSGPRSDELLRLYNDRNVVVAMTDAKLAIGASRNGNHRVAVVYVDSHRLLHVNVGTRLKCLSNETSVRFRGRQHVNYVRL